MRWAFVFAYLKYVHFCLILIKIEENMTRLYLYTYKTTPVHLQNYPCTPTKLSLYIYKTIPVHLQNYPCAPTKLPLYTYKTTPVHLQNYPCL